MGAGWECGPRPGTAPFLSHWQLLWPQTPGHGVEVRDPGQSLAHWPLLGAPTSSSLGGWPQGLRGGLGAPREEAQGGLASWGLSGAARGVAALQRGSLAPPYLYPV